MHICMLQTDTVDKYKAKLNNINKDIPQIKMIRCSILCEMSLDIQWDIQHHSKIKRKYSKYMMGQVRIKQIAYNSDETSQLLIFKNEIVTNY